MAGSEVVEAVLGEVVVAAQGVVEGRVDDENAAPAVLAGGGEAGLVEEAPLLHAVKRVVVGESDDPAAGAGVGLEPRADPHQPVVPGGGRRRFVVLATEARRVGGADAAGMRSRLGDDQLLALRFGQRHTLAPGAVGKLPGAGG